MVLFFLKKKKKTQPATLEMCIPICLANVSCLVINLYKLKLAFLSVS